MFKCHIFQRVISYIHIIFNSIIVKNEKRNEYILRILTEINRDLFVIVLHQSFHVVCLAWRDTRNIQKGKKKRKRRKRRLTPVLWFPLLVEYKYCILKMTILYRNVKMKNRNKIRNIYKSPKSNANPYFYWFIDPLIIPWRFSFKKIFCRARDVTTIHSYLFSQLKCNFFYLWFEKHTLISKVTISRCGRK